MRNLINFILKSVHWLFFLLLVFVSVYLIVNNSQFQRSKYLSVARDIAGGLYSVSGDVEAYFYLQHANNDLMKRVAELENTVYKYEQQLEALKDTTQVRSLKVDSSMELIYTCLPAKVVYNSVSNAENYILLNKGTKDGIERDMGVISATGSIVGVVLSVSSHYCTVIPALNPKYCPNCRVKSNNYFGPLVWDGKDYRYTYLRELPRHINFQINDTVVTSGNSNVFPEGLPVGTIVDSQKQKDDDFTSLKIKLFTNFNTLTHVFIIKNRYKEEQQELLKEVNL